MPRPLRPEPFRFKCLEEPTTVDKAPEPVRPVARPARVLPFPMKARRARQLKQARERLRAAALLIRDRQHELSTELRAAVATVLFLAGGGDS
jgi:hypothetical protein